MLKRHSFWKQYKVRLKSMFQNSNTKENSAPFPFRFFLETTFPLQLPFVLVGVFRAVFLMTVVSYHSWPVKANVNNAMNQSEVSKNMQPAPKHAIGAKRGKTRVSHVMMVSFFLLIGQSRSHQFFEPIRELLSTVNRKPLYSKLLLLNDPFMVGDKFHD